MWESVGPIAIAGSIAALAALVCMSAFFSASETAFTGLHKVKLMNIVKEGGPRAKRAEKALKLAEDYDRLLTTILVGNNLVNILASSICTWLFTKCFGDPGVVLATASMLVVLLIFGEITPKSMSKANSERYALKLTPALSAVQTLLSPVTWIFKALSHSVSKRAVEGGGREPTLTEDELVVMIEQIEGEGTLEKSESELIKSAIEFDDKQVSEILVPRVDVVAVDAAVSVEELKSLFITSGFSRIPVYDGTIDRITGVVYAKDFYAKYFEGGVLISDIVRPVKFIPETTTVARALTEIQRSMVQMLVVVDSYGGTMGIVSLEDILEELVGEIWDESDEVHYPIVREADGSYAVLGEASVSDLMKETGVEFDVGDYEGPTVGGFIQYKLNRVPIKGDRVELDGLKMVVRSTKNRRIKLVQAIVKQRPGSPRARGRGTPRRPPPPPPCARGAPRPSP